LTELAILHLYPALRSRTFARQSVYYQPCLINSMESYDFTNEFPLDDPTWNELDLPSSVLTDLSWNDLFSSYQSSYPSAPEINYLGWTENDELQAEWSMTYTDLSLGFVVPKPSSSKSPTNPQPSTHNVQPVPSTAQQLSKSNGGKSTQSTKSKKKPTIYKQLGEPLFGQFYFDVNSDVASFQLRSRYSVTHLKRMQKLKKDGGACLRCWILKKQVNCRQLLIVLRAY